MKRIVYLLIGMIFFAPIMVNAAECDTSKVYIDSISIDNAKGNVIELEDATVNDKKININLRMSTKNDEILYKVVLKNDSSEDYEISQNNINLNSDYLEYSFESDNNNIVKAKSSRTIYLRVKYKNEVDSSKFVNGVYQDNITMKVNLQSDDTPSNPKTGLPYIIIISLILLISGIALIIYKKKKLSTLMILVGLILLPVGVNALCKCELIIDSKVVIKIEDEFKIYSYGCGNQIEESQHPYRIGMTFNDYLDSTYFSSQSNFFQFDFPQMINNDSYESYIVDQEFFDCREQVVTPEREDYQNASDYYDALQESKNACFGDYAEVISKNDKIMSADKNTYVFRFIAAC